MKKKKLPTMFVGNFFFFGPRTDNRAVNLVGNFFFFSAPSGLRSFRDPQLSRVT